MSSRRGQSPPDSELIERLGEIASTARALGLNDIAAQALGLRGLLEQMRDADRAASASGTSQPQEGTPISRNTR